MMIIIEVVDHKEQRYPTVGDWFFDGSCERIRVSRIGSAVDKRYEFLIAVHELIEWFLCEHHGISERDVDSFDTNHLASDEPGNLKSAPYHKEHLFATKIERAVAKELGVDWKEYSEALAGL